LHFGFWAPIGWLRALIYEYQLSASQTLNFEGQFVRRKICHSTVWDQRARAAAAALSGDDLAASRSAMRTIFWRSSAFSTRVGMRSLSFGDGSCCGAQSIATRLRSGSIPAPPGLDEGYIAEFQGVLASLSIRAAAARARDWRSAGGT
jgi:hypothetical protein